MFIENLANSKNCSDGKKYINVLFSNIFKCNICFWVDILNFQNIHSVIQNNNTERVMSEMNEHIIQDSRQM